MLKTHLSRCKLLLISIRVTDCAHTVNIASHGTANGVPEFSVQDGSQAVVMAAKRAE